MDPTIQTQTESKALPIDLIRADGETQARASLDDDVILDYAEKWSRGVDFAPIDVFFDGEQYWLADGFHRVEGAKKAKRASIPCRIRRGTLRDAILFAAGANVTHGLRRSNADKRWAVEILLGDDEWVQWSDNRIADQIGVSVPFVANVRKQLLTVNSSPAARVADQPRIGRDGKLRKIAKMATKIALPSSIPIGAVERTASISSETGDGRAADRTDDRDQIRRVFREIDQLYGELTRKLDELNRLCPDRLKNDCEQSLDVSYQDFRAWKKRSEGSEGHRS